MPHPNGFVEVDYVQQNDNSLNATVILPAGTSGRFIWNGKEHALKNGKNVLKGIK